MKVLSVLKDNVYPFSYIDHSRLISRAIILNDKKEILLEKIQRDDKFGNATYYETPGGGVNKDEDLKQAVIREVKEECGLVVDVIDEIGIIEDDYNLIHRHNISAYFLCKVKEECSLNREEYESRWIKEIKFIPLKEILDFTSNPSSNIAKVVYQREKIIYQIVNERF